MTSSSEHSRRPCRYSPRSVPNQHRNLGGLWLWLAALSTLLIVVGWWALGQGTVVPNPAVGQPLSQSAKRSAPDFTLALLGSSESFHLAAQKHKATLIMFTASWCADCIPEIPKLAQLYKEQMAQGLNVLVVDLDPTESDTDFLGFKARAGGAEHFWARDKDGTLTRAYNVRATDTKVMIDRNQQIIATTVGSTSLAELRQYAKEALK